MHSLLAANEMSQDMRGTLTPQAMTITNTGLFISTSGISELDHTTTKTDTAERSISMDRESLQVFLY